VNGLWGLPSNRKIVGEIEQEVVTILSMPVYRGFGPTLAAEYLTKRSWIDSGQSAKP
jgi:hypothetical protein